jgi:hypothetical protein
MHSSFFKFNLVLHSVAFFLETAGLRFSTWYIKDFSMFSVCWSSKSWSSTRCSSAVNVICEDDELFGTRTNYFNHIYNYSSGQNYNIANGFLENNAKCEWFGIIIINKFIHDEIKSILNSGISCYHWVQNVSSFPLLPRNVKFKIYKTIILPVVLCGCEKWSPPLREEHWLRVFENKVLWKVFWPERNEVTGDCENCMTRSFINCTLLQI